MAARRSRKSFWSKHPQLTRIFLLAVCFVGSFGIGLGYASWAMVCRAGGCPTVDVLETYTPQQTSKLYAADGRFIAELGLERRTLVKLAEIPPIVQNAFIATEDKRFTRCMRFDIPLPPFFI